MWSQKVPWAVSKVATRARLLNVRALYKIKRPMFIRQQSTFVIRVGPQWRRPRGGLSKQRRGMAYRPPYVKVGYGGPAAVRGLHPSGYEDILICTIGQLNDLNNATQAIRMSTHLGMKKRLVIEARAEELGFKILNKSRAVSGVDES